MGQGDGIYAKCFINDFDIENHKKVILNKAKMVVQNCHDLGISFRENDDFWQHQLSRFSRMINKLI